MLCDLTIQNYKSLRNIRLQNLPGFCGLVGANASGKSNFADALDFLAIVVRDGLTAAVRTKGGYENICFRRFRRSKGTVEFDVMIESDISIHPEEKVTKFRIEFSFGFRAATEKITADYFVTRESLRITSASTGQQLFRLTRGRSGRPELSITDAGEQELRLPPRRILDEWVGREEEAEDELAITRLAYIGIVHVLLEDLGGLRIYQISPHTARAPGVPERSPELGKHGENLPAAVQYLRDQHADAFEELVAHLTYAVAGMEAVETDYVETKELGLFFREQGVRRRWYSQDVSDGTLKTVSIFLPLLDPRVSMVVLEEPENSLHPWILRHFIDTCKEKAVEKQIFVTTHSPAAVDKIPLESLFIVSRAGGETRIESAELLSPEARQLVHEQLYGLGEYWDSGAMGGVPEPTPQ